MAAVVEVPGQLRLLVQKLREVKDKKDALNEQLDSLKKEEEGYEKVLIEQMQLVGSNSMRFEEATVSIKPEVYYSLEDWSRTAEWALKEGRIDLFQRRLSKDAVLDVLEKTGGLPPGVATGERMRINFRRSKG